MKKDSKTFKEVAERCTRFTPNESKNCGCSNSTTGENVSCSNCTHYEPNNVCTLDLYREIVTNHHL
ncbi:MAG: hypothetical protein SO170_10685 [Butyribacter sp.]|nr:hypothetical protein [bacterium]MDY3855402.1 hypothetical protein [Butyribacter sp.]